MEWKESRAEEIMNQFRRMGLAFDWDRFTFTLDSNYKEAVTELFCSLYEKRLIYRGKRAVNWCPALQSVISDIEIDVKDVGGKMYYLDYGNGVIVATTRPETIYADVAVAIHSSDTRYKHLTHCTNPLTGEALPLICDDVLVDAEFGTGVVKITPNHSVEDHDCAVRHQLRMDMEAFDERGLMNENTHVAGMDRIKARKLVVEILQEKGKLLKEEDHQMRVGTCSRTGDLLEPSWKSQWFVKCESMCDRVLTYTDDMIPEKYKGEWRYFLENSRDWCISRQLWWGHRIPAYLVDGEWVISRTPPPKFERQDEDVLDTWFSSALFPLAGLGWPQSFDAARYPLSIMETGSDILFFWVARMAMICSELFPETGSPFERVMLHPMVRDRMGRKMSKSLGNVLDPLHLIDGVTLEAMIEKLQSGQTTLSKKEVERSVKGLKKEFPRGIPKCGADAVRFSLIDAESNDSVNLDVENVVAVNRMCNKIWNAAKFVQSRPLVEVQISPEELQAPERWILAKLNLLSNQMVAGFEGDNIHRCTKELKSFLLSFCDHYLEYAKHHEANDVVNHHLHFVFRSFLVQLTPFMPFLSEHLLQVLYEDAPLRVASQVVEINQEADLEPFAHVIDIISAVRQLKTMRKEPFKVYVTEPFPKAEESYYSHIITHYIPLVKKMARFESIVLGSPPPAESDCLTVPVRHNMAFQVFPKQEKATEEDAAFVQKKLNRLTEKLAKLDAKWAKMDLSRVKPVAQENFKKTRGILQSQIDSLKKNAD
jgi:valyl-tRNA synthetase